MLHPRKLSITHTTIMAAHDMVQIKNRCNFEWVWFHPSKMPLAIPQALPPKIAIPGEMFSFTV